jgi:hypothetical protein
MSNLCLIGLPEVGYIAGIAVLIFGINGSGTINLKAGNAEEADYSITTDGEIMAFGVAVPEVNCKITGKGSAQIHPTDNLKATIVGKGNIRYKGPTAVQQKVIGKGTVEEVK